MKIISNPEKKDWKELLQRPYADNTAVLQTVNEILNEVKKNGDVALKEFSKKFNGVTVEELRVSHEEIAKAGESLPAELKAAIQQAKK